MSAVIDLSKKRNRIILALDIFLGTVLFSECWPTGVSFSAPTTFAGGLTICDLAAGTHKAVWVRRTVNAGAAAYADSFTLRVQGDRNP